MLCQFVLGMSNFFKVNYDTSDTIQHYHNAGEIHNLLKPENYLGLNDKIIENVIDSKAK